MRRVDQPVHHCIVIHTILEDFFTQYRFVLHPDFLHDAARSCVAVKQLPKNVLCEVEISAYLGK